MTTQTDDMKLGAILAALKTFEKRLKDGGLTGDEKAEFSKAVAELEAFLQPNLDRIEVPRLVKKPNGETKRVDTKDELDAALKDGWLLKLPSMPEVATDSSEAIRKDALANGDEKTAAAASDAGTPDDVQSFSDRIAALSAKDAVTAIEAHTNVEELKAHKKIEERVTVERAIEHRLDELK